MKLEPHITYISCDLSISPLLAEVSSDNGVIRLGPINMKILLLLISHSGELVSRTAIFDYVWPNQVVSEDALTKCISDIRTQLKHLSPDQTFIETLPKRGYRWVKEVKTENDTVTLKSLANSQESRIAPANNTQANLKAWVNKGLLYLAAILFIASASVWIVDALIKPDLPIIAILPIQSSSTQSEFFTNFEEGLRTNLLLTEKINVLSRSAVASRPNNPFPYFYNEFRARWVLEFDTFESSDQLQITIAMVDARSGIVLFQTSEEFIKDDKLKLASRDFKSYKLITAYLEAEIEPQTEAILPRK